MKTLVRSALSVALLLALSACGVDQPVAGGAEPAPQPAAPAPAAPTQGVLVASEPVATDNATSLNADCNVEGVDGVLFTGEALPLAASGSHEVTGWVVDLERKAVPADLMLVVAGVGDTGGTWTASAPSWIERAGVVESRGYPAELKNSGFAFKIDSGTLAKGLYHVYVMSNEGGRVAVCDPGRQISVGP